MGSMKVSQPAGVRDQWGEPLALLRQYEQRFLSLLALYGYMEVSTPILEDHGLIAEADPRLEQRGVVKLIDRQGQILILRPDMTVPIARVIATHLRHDRTPHRLGYWATVHRTPTIHEGQESEFIQAGAELVGVSGPAADAEVIALSSAALDDLGLRAHVIEIGQVAFFRDMIESSGASPAEQEQIRHLIHVKNAGELRQYLDQLRLNNRCVDALCRLPELFGTVEAVMPMAAQLVNSPGTEEALTNLDQTLQLLKTYGLAEQVRLDLGLIPDLTYYTGVIFRGLTSHVGSPIVSGGRYDQLLAKFGHDLPATGFALHMGRVLQSLWQKGAVSPLKSPLKVVTDEAQISRDWDLVRELRRVGCPSILALPGETVTSAALIATLDGWTGTVDGRELFLGSQDAVIRWVRDEVIREVSSACVV